MMLSLSAEDRALLQDSQMMNSFYEDDPSAKLDWLDMQRAAREAEKKYNEAYRLTPSDDYRQHARIFREGAGIYDILGDTEGAGQLREAEEAAIARAEESETINSDCLIVTATFGSPMATEVQLVRTFRDDTVKQNYLGSRYVTALNAMYYSFSPVVARTIDENPSVKPVMRVILAPLISIVLLSQGVYSLLGFSPGVATIFFIIIGGSLVGLVYVLPVILPVIWLAVRRAWDIPPVGSIKSLVIMWAGLLAALLVSALIQFDIIAVLSSGLLFVCTVFLTAGAVALYLFRCMEIQPVGLE